MNSLRKTQAINLLTQFDQLLQETAEEVRKELDAPISGVTADEIALEYKFREGQKNGIKLFLTRLNRYARES